MKSNTRSSITLFVPAAAGILFAVLVYVLPIQRAFPEHSYLPFHIVMETINSFIDVLIFFLAWNSLKRELTGYTLLFACAFLGVAVTEIIHVLSHTGLTDVLTSFGHNQIAYFNFIARALVALSLNIVAFQVWPTPVSKKLKYLFLGLSLAIVFAIESVVVRYIDFLPRLMIGDNGTLFKSAINGGLILFFALATFGSFRRAGVKNGTDFRLLCIANSMLVVSQLCLVLQSVIFSKLQVLSHLYLAISHWIIFRAIFVSNFEAPFLKLDRSEKMLREAVKTRDEFLTIAGHELRTPLTPLRAQFQLIKMELNHVQAGEAINRAHLLKFTTNIGANLERLTRLINNLIDVAVVRSGQPLSLKLQYCSLEEVIRKFLVHSASEIKASGATVSFVSSEPVDGYWDSPRIEQLMSNLLSNSIKYARGAPIRIRLERSDETVRLHYEDQGGGIPAEKLCGIVGPSCRVASENIDPGLGVGLFMARKIAEAHEGSIQIKSERGKGISILIVFPLRKTVGSPVHPPSTSVA